MAEVAYSVTRNHPHDGDVVIVTWGNITEADTGQWYVLPARNDVTVQVKTLAGTTPNMRWQGYLDPDDIVAFTLADPQGNALDFTAAGAEAVLENVYAIRPIVSAGTGVTSTSCLMAK